MAFRFREDSKKEFEKLDYSDLQWDEEYLQPAEGFPPIKTREYPESVWDEALWPLSPSKNRPRRLIMKGQAKKKFLLTDKDMEDLVYRYEQRGLYMSKNFLYRQVERRAWEKYGGPTGLSAAAKVRKRRRDRPLGGGSVTKNPKVKGGLTKKRGRERPSVTRNIKAQTLRATTMPTPSVTAAAAAAAVQMEETIPSTPRKHGNLVRLHTQPGISTLVQDNIAGPSTPRHARTSGSAIAALDNFAARSPTSSPVKRRRESEPGPSTPRLKQQRVFWIDVDDNEPPPRSPTPLSSPVKQKVPRTSLSSPVKGKMPHTPKHSSPPMPRQKAKVQDDVLELTGSEDDYVPMKSIDPKKSKSISPAKKGLALIRDEEVIEISD